MGFAVVPIPGVEERRTSRGAARYPIHLRVTLIAEGHACEAVTENISASGVLLRLERPLPVGQEIEFLVEIPTGVLEFSVTAALHCSGRIVRSFWKNGEPRAAAVIDEYRFQ